LCRRADDELAGERCADDRSRRFSHETFTVITAQRPRSLKGIVMIKFKALLCGVILILCSPLGSAGATTLVETFVSGAGNDSNDCSFAHPCRSFNGAYNQTEAGGQITVVDTADYGSLIINKSISIVNATSGTAALCCNGASLTSVGGGAPITFTAQIFILANATDIVTLRGLELTGQGLSGTSAVLIANAERVNIENCIIRNASNSGILVAPNTMGIVATLAPNINIKVQDTTITGSSGGIKVTSVAGVTVNAAIHRSQIDNNIGGGIRIDGTSGGVVTATISDSHIASNGGNGVNVVGSTSNVMVTLLGDVIGFNSSAGVQTNGTSAAAVLNGTSLLNNASALSVVGGGRILTYGNNSIVGSSGSGFTGTATLQ
jgi:hypothetical protein